MNRMNSIDILLDKKCLEMGIERYHKLSLNTASWLVFGPSGSGKSVLVKTIIGRLSVHFPDAKAKVTVCDGKADDYTFLRGTPGARYYEFMGIKDGLTAFYQEFEDRLKGNPDRSPRIIVLEEWGSYLRMMEATDKKAAQVSLSQLFSITSQGRAFNVHALLSTQRPDSSLLTGFRENLTVVVGLHRISPEAARMVGFNEYPNFNNEECGQGIGWLLTDNGLASVCVPQVQNFQKLHEAIKDAVTR